MYCEYKFVVHLSKSKRNELFWHYQPRVLMLSSLQYTLSTGKLHTKKIKKKMTTGTFFTLIVLTDYSVLLLIMWMSGSFLSLMPPLKNKTKEMVKKELVGKVLHGSITSITNFTWSILEFFVSNKRFPFKLLPDRLALSCRRSLLYRNQSNDLLCK